MRHINCILVFFMILNISFAQTTQTYQYDANQQLVKVFKLDGSTITYQYDELGNRTTISQSINTQSSVLKINPISMEVSAISGDSIITITNIGYGTMNWSATTNTPWLSISGSKSGTDSGSVTINYQANSGIKRIGTIVVTAPDADNSPQTITIEQSALEFSNHVWHVATNGSDITGNGKIDKPFATIQKGIEMAAVSDTVLVHPGTFNKNIDFNGKNIFVTSEYYLTQDTATINNTIIKGSGGRVVRIANHESEKAVLNGITITGGSATTDAEPSGGGIFIWSSTPTLLNLKVANNNAKYGGGIDINTASPYLYNIKVFNNTAFSSGGGINCNQASPQILNSTISGNIAQNGAGLVFYNRSDALVANCLVSKNMATTNGGGINVNASNPHIVNSTIVYNSAPYGSGIDSYLSSPLITNSIVWQNNVTGIANITYSDIQSGYSGTGNININPEFNDTISSNFSLKGFSPCLNVGKSDTTGLKIGVKDIIGNSRVYGSAIDMGAYEYQNNPIPGKAGTITGITTLCQGTSNVTYSLLPITNAISYIWTVPRGATGTSISNTITLNYSDTALSGDLKVKGRNNNIDGMESSLKISVNSIPEPTGTITGDIIVCKGASNLDYSVTAIQGATSYEWSLPLGSTGSSTSKSISVTFGKDATSGSIKVKGKNDCGYGLESTLAITVNTIPNPAGVIEGKSNVCKGASNLDYSVTDVPGATSYEWSLPTGATGSSTSKSISVTFSDDAISESIKVKGKNDCGYGLESTLAITVNDIPDVTGVITGKTTACTGESNITYEVSGILRATSYIWSLPPNVTVTGSSTVNTIPVTFESNAVSGSINVKGHNVCGDGKGSSLEVIVNKTPPTPEISFNKVWLQSTEKEGIQWYKDNNLIQNATNSDFRPSQPGNYSAVVTLNTCPSLPSNQISVNQRDIDTVNLLDGLLVYPNPTTGFIDVALVDPFESDYTVAVYNNMGRLLQTITKGKSEINFKIDLSKSPAGLYIIQLYTNDKSLQSKVIKR